MSLPSPLACTHEFMISTELTTEQKCQQLASACANQQEVLNFFKIYFCILKANNMITTPLLILSLILILNFIVAAVEDYIAPAIVFLSQYLGLSESLAGVTLLAFANGAGDVLTAIVAGGSADGISYNVGALYGAGLFVITLVVGMTILNSPEDIVVDKSLIFRDIGFYMFATAATLYMAYIEKITFNASISFLVLYLVLVVIVVI